MKLMDKSSVTGFTLLIAESTAGRLVLKEYSNGMHTVVFRPKYTALARNHPTLYDGYDKAQALAVFNTELEGLQYYEDTHEELSGS